jgi:hypothetical protein
MERPDAATGRLEHGAANDPKAESQDDVEMLIAHFLHSGGIKSIGVLPTFRNNLQERGVFHHRLGINAIEGVLPDP